MPDSMTDVHPPMTANAPRIVLFGMRCRFSAAVFKEMLARDCQVAGVLLAGEPGEATGRDLPLDSRYAGLGTIEAIAGAARVPVRAVVDARQPILLDALHGWRPDVIAVACFPWRLPPEVLALPRLGALNVHPAVLPRHRGPDPLFWTFHDGDAQTGVTVHLMTDRLDAGPIVAQTRIDVPFGIDGAELEARLARLGGELLAGAMARRAREDFSAIEQDESSASTEGLPGADDLLISTDQSGRWAYSFVRGIASLGFSATVSIAPSGERIAVERVHAYLPGERQSEPIIRKNDRVRIQFVDGICEFAVNNLRKTIKLHIDTGNGVVR